MGLITNQFGRLISRQISRHSSAIALVTTLFLSPQLWADTEVSASTTLPENMEWQTNNDDPNIGSDKAIKGGTFRIFTSSYPITFRTVGPDSNSSFRSYILDNQLGLTSFHPNTENVIPELATHWAYGEDGKTVFYKLHPDARWSDGKPITADDYLFTLEFMRSKHIVAPWYNNHFTNEIIDVKKYDDHTISVTGATQRSAKELHYYYGLSPTPKHFYTLDEGWVKRNNWRIAPNSGPYQISETKTGKYIVFERKKDWWAKDLHYFKNRYNVNKVRIQVIREVNVAYKHFEKAKLDTFPLILPNYWYNKTNSDIYNKGYVDRYTFFNDMARPSSGIFLNLQKPIFQNENVRYGIAHALNFDKVIKTLLRGDYERLPNFQTGYGEFTNTEVQPRGFDIKKAVSYFNKAGWTEKNDQGIFVKDGNSLSFKLSYTAATHTDRLVLLKEEAKKAGLELQLQRLEPSSFFKSVREKKHDAAWMAWGGAGFRPAYWQFFHSDNADIPQTNNITNTKNPEMDQLITAYRKEVDEAKRQSLSRDIQALIHKEGSIITRTMITFTRGGYWKWMQIPEFAGTKISDDIFEPFGGKGGLFWIDVDLKKKILKDRKSGKTYPPQNTVYDAFKAK